MNAQETQAWLEVLELLELLSESDVEPESLPAEEDFEPGP